MTAFEKVIGFDEIKNELIQLCDMLKNKAKYEKLGAKLPQGIMLVGNPGTGKTLLSNCIIEEAGLPVYVVRKTRNDFAEEISKAFSDARENAPAIVFLDDMDKLANEADPHRNPAEFIAVQSGIDSCKGSEVFVIATVNSRFALPESLCREGRFDRKYNVNSPNLEDSVRIVEHYLSDKALSDDTNRNDVTRMFTGMTCAKIEVVLNDAAIRAAYKGLDRMGIDEIKEAYLRIHYDTPDYYVETDEERVRKVALHEAGHIVVSEYLNPGSVGIASISEKRIGMKGGFVRQYKNNVNNMDNVLIALAGKTAVELYYSDNYTEGCHSDLMKAYWSLQQMICEDACLGFVNMSSPRQHFVTENDDSDLGKAFVQMQIKSELERCMRETRRILIEHRNLLERFADELITRKTLLYSDVQAIAGSDKIQG